MCRGSPFWLPLGIVQNDSRKIFIQTLVEAFHTAQVSWQYLIAAFLLAFRYDFIAAFAWWRLHKTVDFLTR